jgi:hypothetical protein
MNNYKEDIYMDLMKKFGKDDDARVISDFITGEPINSDREENDILQKVQNGILEFENIEAAMKVENVKDPIFFVPMNRFAPMNNVVQTAREPYSDVVFNSAKFFNRICPKDRAVLTSVESIIYQCVDVALTNIYTIFNNGTLLLLKSFYRNNDNFLVDQFKNCMMDNAIRAEIYDMGKQLADSLLVYKLNDDTKSCCIAFGASLSQIKTRVAMYLARSMYDYIRSMLLYEAVDLDGLLGYFECESAEKIDYREETEMILESAKYSICVQEMLNIVTDDIARCEEMVEINFVTLFYNINDLTTDAIKAGVYTKDNISKSPFERPQDYLVDRFKY